MIDNSDTEIAALNNTYNELDANRNTLNSNVKILICHWLIIKAWKLKLLTKLVPKTGNQRTVKTKEETRAKKKEALEMMMGMMLSEAGMDFGQAYDAFHAWYLENDYEWEPLNVYNCFKANYEDKKTH